jgi:DNA-directed RNA polymerase specialized sigma24 family protein
MSGGDDRNPDETSSRREPSSHSVSAAIRGAVLGEPESMSRISGYFFKPLTRAVEELFRRNGRSALKGADDIANEAFQSYYKQASTGRDAWVQNRVDLWKLLHTIVYRKVIHQLARERLPTHGGGRVTLFSGLVAPGSDDSVLDFGERAADDHEPSPEAHAMVQDAYQQARAAIRDEWVRVVLDLLLEGYSQREIAAKLDIALTTVFRAVEVIRKTFRTVLGDDSEE